MTSFSLLDHRADENAQQIFDIFSVSLLRLAHNHSQSDALKLLCQPINIPASITSDPQSMLYWSQAVKSAFGEINFDKEISNEDAIRQLEDMS